MATENKGKGRVDKQAHIPFAKTLEIALNSLKIRFGRSLITAAGIFLGIAFLSTVFTQSLMQWPLPEKVDSGALKIDGQIGGPGDYDVWKPMTKDEAKAAGFSAEVVAAATNDAGNVSLTKIAQGIAKSKDADQTLKDMLSAQETVKKLDPKSYTGDKSDKDQSVEDWVKAGVPQKMADELGAEGKVFKGKALEDAIAALPDKIEAQKMTAEDLGIFKTVNEAEFAKLADSRAYTLDEAIKNAKGWGKDADNTNIMIVNESGKKQLINLDADKTAASIRIAAGDYIFIADKNTRYRTYWLVVMSLLVCAVGITNSMLMSVTERFKEIGTMKCLGAMDRFVVMLFMIESSLMGIIASALGWLVGFLSIVLIAGFTRGWAVVGSVTAIDVFKTFLASLGIGLVLTIIATIPPAKRAADMPPAMALRSHI